DFSISNITIIGNVGQARTVGAEFDLSWLPTDNLNLSLAGSYNKAELEEPFWIDERDEGLGIPPDAPKGTEMPFVPEFQFTTVARYNMDFGRFPGYLQAAASYTGASWNFLEVADRLRQDGYTL